MNGMLLKSDSRWYGFRDRRRGRAPDGERRAQVLRHVQSLQARAEAGGSTRARIPSSQSRNAEITRTFFFFFLHAL